MLKCKLRAISRFPLQALRRLTATPKRENGIKEFFFIKPCQLQKVVKLYELIPTTDSNPTCKLEKWREKMEKTRRRRRRKSREKQKKEEGKRGGGGAGRGGRKKGGGKERGKKRTTTWRKKKMMY